MAWNPKEIMKELQQNMKEVGEVRPEVQAFVEFTGKPPLGSVAPWWEGSAEAAELLIAKGIRYGRWGRPVAV